MPCTELFDEQKKDYRKEVLGSHTKVFIEAGHGDFWNKYSNDNDLIISIDKFGESAPINDLMNHFGFTADKILKKIQELITK